MNWGKGLALVLIAFAGMMAYFLVRGAQSPEPLIAEDYYEQELKYQERIDAMQRANSLSAAITITAARDRVQLGFPAELHGKAIDGTLELMRMNAPDADRRIALHGPASASMDAAVDLVPGIYVAQLAWAAEGATYFASDRILVP